MSGSARARAWAEEFRRMLDDGSTGGGEPWRHAQGDRTPEQARFDYYQSCLRVVSARAIGMRDGGESVVEVLSKVWVEELPTGYCTAAVRPVAGEYAILVDSGLSSSIALASRLIARHFPEGLLVIDTAQFDSKDSFERIFGAFLGQYHLYGRYRQVPHLDLSNEESRWSHAVSHEALTFVLAHEIGHVIAGHRVSGQSTRWLQAELLTAEVLAAGEEIEADALAVQLVLGDLWGETAARGVVDLRLVAIRLAFVTLGAVERCYLVPDAAQHLPAARRWAGVRAFLESRFPKDLLDEHDRYWNAIADTFAFGPVADVEPPAVSLRECLTNDGWGVAWTAEEDRFWQETELASWQYRLEPEILRFLIGAEAVGHEAVPDLSSVEVIAMGERVVSVVAAGLPNRLTVGGARGQVGTSDLVYFLRRRERWPEPFRSDETRALPLHLVAAAIATRRREGGDGV